MVKSSTYHRNRALLQLLLVMLVVVAANLLAERFYFRWDLTKEKRYTLTKATKQLLKNVEKPVTIEVFLEGKDLPAGVRSLQRSTREMLQDFRSFSGGKVTFDFIDINTVKDAAKKEALQKNLAQLGLFPINLQVNAEQGYREQLIFPGLVMRYNNREMAVTLLENQLSFGAQGSLNNSVNFLEYKLAAALQKLTMEKPPLIAFDQAHGELNVAQLNDLVQTLGAQQYRVASVDLTQAILSPKEVDILVIAKPSRPFAEAEKFKIDQYIMHGGRVLWLLDQAIASLDSFGSSSGIVAVDMPLNLTDLLFKYGVRVNTDLVQDLFCNPIPIMEDRGGGAKPVLFPWVFHPMLRSRVDHPIVKNLDPVAAKFASSLDTIRTKGTKKTVLLATSEYSRTVGTPFVIDLQGAKEKPVPALFNKQFVPVALLLEGTFASAFSSRMDDNFRSILSGSNNLDFRPQSPANRMIVISDGDIAANELDAQGNPLPLGYYKYTQETFANRDFLLNCIEYLLDNSGLLEARNREVSMRLLDKTKVTDKKSMWQVVLIGGPLLALGLFAGFYNSRRKKRFAA